MTTVTVFRDKHGRLAGFEAAGHAGFAEAGNDIVCAAVSALVINTVNALEQFTKDELQTEVTEEPARIRLRISADHSREAELLLRTLILGITNMKAERSYTDHLDLIYEEVTSC